MGRFFQGFLLGAFFVVAGVLFYLVFGMVDPRADTPVNPVENTIVSSSLDAAVKHFAPQPMDTVPANDTNMLAAMKLYQSDCAHCHGDPGHPVSAMADSFKPRAPQFMEHPPNLLTSQNFYVIKHGLSWTGMPAWNYKLNDHQIWQLSVFLDQFGSLSPAVKEAWKTASAAPGQRSRAEAENHLAKAGELANHKSQE